jgi:hypothetical protein
MEKYSGLVQQLLLTAIIGVVSLGVSFIGELSKGVQVLTLSVQELNLKIDRNTWVISDHEVRLRVVETKHKNKG